MMICHDNVYCFVDSFSGEHDTYSVQNIKWMYLYIWLLVSRQTHSNDFTINLSADVFLLFTIHFSMWVDLVASTKDSFHLYRSLFLFLTFSISFCCKCYRNGTEEWSLCYTALTLQFFFFSLFDWVWSENVRRVFAEMKKKEKNKSI